MKYIKIPEDTLLETLAGEPITDETGAPAAFSFHQFLISRLADPAFVGDRKGTDAAFLVFDAKSEIDKQRDKAPGDLLALESATYVAIKRATEKPINDYDPRFRHCLVPIFRAISEAKEEPEA